MGDDFNIDDVVQGYEDTELAFKDTVLGLISQCESVAEIFGAAEYENLLSFKTKRRITDHAVIDDCFLQAMEGKFKDTYLGRLAYPRTNKNALSLARPLEQYSIGDGRVIAMMGRIITSAYEQLEDQSFKIIGVDYFSFLKYRNGNPFLNPAYFCSKTGYFKSKKNVR